MSYIEWNLGFHQIILNNVNVTRKCIESYRFLSNIIEISNCAGDNMHIHTSNMSYCNSSTINRR